MREMSLRARLLVLGALAALATGAAGLVAWRLAVATDAFTVRQAEFAVQAAATRLSHDIQDVSDGRPMLGAGPGGSPEPAGSTGAPRPPGSTRQPLSPPPAPPPPSPPPPPLPPHVREIFATYADPLDRVVALALHAGPRVAGGVADEQGRLTHVVARELSLTARDRTLVGDAVREALARGDTTTQSVREGDQQILFTVVPLVAVASLGMQSGTGLGAESVASLERQSGTPPVASLETQSKGKPDTQSHTQSEPQSKTQSETPSGTQPKGVSIPQTGGLPKEVPAAVWALTQVSSLTSTGQWLNAAALMALGLVLVAIVRFAWVTVRDINEGIMVIEQGLTGLSNSLDTAVAAPDPPELARIGVAINRLAADLRAHRARQRALEDDVRRHERLAGLGRLVAGVAHEVRNPLASMGLKLQLAQRSGYDRDKIADTFRVLGEEIARLDGLVRRLLELGRPLALHLAPVDLTALLRDRMRFVDEKAERGSVRIILDASDRPALALADRDRISQVIDNLIENALAAMAGGGVLTIGVTEVGDDAAPSVVMTFTDTGPGVRAEDRDRIFEPFYTGRDGGVGLGLPIAREVVEAHHGRLVVDAAAGGGATFRVSLPAPPSVAGVA